MSNLMNCNFSLLLLFLFFSYTNLYAQETTIYTEQNKHLKRAEELLSKKLYLPAMEEVKALKNQAALTTDNNRYTLMMFADFYEGLCAARTQEKNAELLFTRFTENYHNTSLRNKAFYELGNYYFNRNNSKRALDYYEKVKNKLLSNEEFTQYNFNYAYLLFKRKNFEEAKPLFKTIKSSKNSYTESATYYYAFITFYEKNYKEAEEHFEILTTSNRYKDVIPYYLTQIYFLRKNYQKVLDYALPLLKKPKTENKQEISHIVGQAYFELEAYENAAPLLDTYIQNASKVSTEEMYQLAYSQYKTKEYREAVKNFKSLDVAEDSLGQNAMYCLGDSYIKLNEKENAKDAFQQASSMNFDEQIQETSRFQAAKLNLELGNTNLATASFTNFLKNYPNSIYRNETGLLLSKALSQNNNFQQALQILEEYNVSGSGVNELYQKLAYNRAIELFNDKNNAEAKVYINKALSKSTNQNIEAASHFIKGSIDYETQLYASSITHFSKYLFLQGNQKSNITYANASIANYNIAYAYFKLKEYGKASTFFEKSIQSSSINSKIYPDAVLRNADCLFITRNYNRALENYNKVIENKWQDAEYAYIQKSLIQGLQGNFLAKVKTLEQLNNSYPTNAYKEYAIYQMGVAYLDANDFDNAIYKFQTISTAYANSSYAAQAGVKLGLAYFNTKKINPSIKAYKKVVKDYPKTEESNQALAALKELYIFLGKADEYISFIQNDIGVSMSSLEQDNLLNESILTLYNNKQCEDLIQKVTQYEQRFPNGQNIIQALFYRANCLFNSKSYKQALQDYSRVGNSKISKYSEESLLKASYISYKINKNYLEAKNYYIKLNEIASTQENIEIAEIGQMRCAFFLSDLDNTLHFANNVLSSNSYHQDIRNEAHFYKAKAHLINKEYDLAEFHFLQVLEKMPFSVSKAEAAYSIAYILNKKYLYEKSNEECFKLKNDYAAYEYWVVKTYILIADNYWKLDNSFQAKATLESVLDNYSGDQKLINEATELLEMIKLEEINTSKINTETTPIDTIEFDEE